MYQAEQALTSAAVESMVLMAAGLGIAWLLSLVWDWRRRRRNRNRGRRHND